jgi:hypothetical protein
MSLTAKELCTKLGIDARQLGRLVKDGLPHAGRGKKRTFDAAAVAAWLQTTGRAQPAAPVPPQIAATKAEAAVLCGVSLRVMGDWLTDPTFPGKAGSPGRQDGYFPIAEIKAWRSATRGGDHRSDAAATQEIAAERLRRLRIEADRDHFELEQDLGNLLDFEQTARLQERAIATAQTQLDQIVERALARLPSKTPRRIRRIVRQAITEGVAAACDALADSLATDADDEVADDAAAAAEVPSDARGQGARQ